LLPKHLRIHAVLIVACLAMILIPLYTHNKKPDDQKLEQAQPVAAEFLALVDDGKYAESWQSLAPLVRDKVKQQEWIEKLDKARSRSGGVVQRAQKSTRSVTALKDSPEGEYIIISYESDFQKAEDVSEYVAVMRDGDSWKVAGYSIQ
jgi:hypothetical protein